MTGKAQKIIVIGTSAGGMQALCRLFSRLPDDLQAAIFVVQHVSVDSSTEILINRIQQFTGLTCKVAENYDTIRAGTLYMAPPDRHLLLREEDMLVVRGPRENQFRPAIDSLFRSAAAYHGARTIGVILTGFMSDGVLGMECISRSGGMTVVQAPHDAEFAPLPQNVLRHVKTDHVASLDEMGELLPELVQQPVTEAVAVPTDIFQETKIAERVMTNSTMTNIGELDKAGDRTPYSCPECGGGLWDMSEKGTMNRYRCHSGHTYSRETLLLGIDNNLEETLWIALRTLEERRNILLNMSQHETDRRNRSWATLQEKKAEEMKVHIDRLRSLLAQTALSKDNELGEAS